MRERCQMRNNSKSYYRYFGILHKSGWIPKKCNLEEILHLVLEQFNGDLEEGTQQWMPSHQLQSVAEALKLAEAYTEEEKSTCQHKGTRPYSAIGRGIAKPHLGRTREGLKGSMSG